MEYKTTLSKIFCPSQNHFAVPNYQRAYTWEVGNEKDRQIPQFLNDLKEHPDSVLQYHFGHFLFEQDVANKNKYWVIDGQQRLTTAIIFLSCVYKRIKDLANCQNEADSLYTLYLRNSDGLQKFFTVEYDNNYFSNLIIDDNNDDVDTRSRRKIKEAKEYFDLTVAQTDLTEVLRWKRLLENSKITTDTVDDKSEATQIFTFQNDRGKDLTNLEKLKAFLMLQIFLAAKHNTSDPNSAIGFIEKEFESIYKAVEGIEIANEDQVLNYHTIAFLPTANNAIEQVKSAIGKIAIHEKQNWIKKFIVELKSSFKFIHILQEKRKDYPLIADIIFLDQPNSTPLLIKLMHHHQLSELQPIFKLIEIILFKLKYTVGNYYSNHLPRYAYDYRENDLEGIKKRLFQAAKLGFKDYWNFEQDFRRYLEGNNHYFSLTRYLLWKHENHLRNIEKEPPMLFFDFMNLYGAHKFENTIDHWTPQNPSDINHGNEFKEKYLHNIGNMLLSTRGRNASDSNKLPIERSTTSVLISRQKLEKHKGDWDKDKIKQRQTEIVDFAMNYWSPDNVK